jgi:negative regulator of genetic competence, sporulation and motility
MRSCMRRQGACGTLSFRVQQFQDGLQLVVPKGSSGECTLSSLQCEFRLPAVARRLRVVCSILVTGTYVS